MATQVQLTSSDGHSFAAYVAQPAGKPKGAVLVLPEIFGINRHVKSVADGYAADGYLAIAPGYFDRVQRGFDVGYDPQGMEAGIAIMKQMKWDDALKDTDAAIAHVKSAGKVGILGFCWGGSLAWAAAAKANGLACAVPYYPGAIATLADENPTVPVLCHFGELDKSPTPEVAREVLAKHPEVTGHFYPGAGHGFNCEERGSYNPEASKLARSRTLEFLKKHVG